MPIVIDLYSRRHSWVHDVDPRVKLLFVASSLLLLLVFKKVFIMLTAVVLVHLLHWSALIPRNKFTFVWKTLLPVCLLMFSLWVIFYPTGDPIAQLWVVKITPISIAQGLVLALRIMSMAFVVFAWLYTTDHFLVGEKSGEIKNTVRVGVGPFSSASVHPHLPKHVCAHI